MEPAADFLCRLNKAADTTPSMIMRADLLRLLRLAGLAGTQTFATIAEGSADQISSDVAALMETVRTARNVSE